MRVFRSFKSRPQIIVIAFFFANRFYSNQLIWFSELKPPCSSHTLAVNTIQNYPFEFGYLFSAYVSLNGFFSLSSWFLVFDTKRLEIRSSVTWRSKSEEGKKKLNTKKITEKNEFRTKGSIDIVPQSNCA